ncbi:hypothetical protein QE152_g30251 [Popillia japonica]|uniref:Uncharacterized protein n=1 Tax=Popillia japonica TaxID=7064 RepID=A0AAW1JEU9_POPJA
MKYHTTWKQLRKSKILENHSVLMTNEASSSDMVETKEPNLIQILIREPPDQFKYPKRKTASVAAKFNTPPPNETITLTIVLLLFEPKLDKDSTLNTIKRGSSTEGLVPEEKSCQEKIQHNVEANKKKQNSHLHLLQ